MPGWLKRVWPNLRKIVATTSGAYVTIVPEVNYICSNVYTMMTTFDQLRHYLGPDVEIHSLGITSTESYYALPYDVLDGELYRLSDGDDFIEFLPLGLDRRPSLLRASVSIRES